MRKSSLVPGALYLLTVVSIPTLFLYGPVKALNYITGPGPDTGALFGGLSELSVALVCIGYLVVKGFRPSGMAKPNLASTPSYQQ